MRCSPLAARRPCAQHLLPFLTSSWCTFSQLSQHLWLQAFKVFHNCVQDGSSIPKLTQTPMLNSIHCPDEKLNLALPIRKGRYRTSKDPRPFRSHNLTSSWGDWMGKSLLWNVAILNIYTFPYHFKAKVGCKQFHCTTHFYCHRAAAISYEGTIVLKLLTRNPSKVVLCKDFFSLKRMHSLKHLFQTGCQLLKILSHARCKAQKNVM